MFDEGDSEASRQPDAGRPATHCSDTVMAPPAGWAFFFAIVISSMAGELNDSVPSPQQCGGRSNASVQVLMLRSPECRLVVEPSSPSVCSLTLDLSSLTLPACPSDQLTVGDRSLCGVGLGVVHLPFTYPHTVITYRGAEDGGGGFSIEVQQRECNSVGDTATACDQQLSGEMLVIESPGYPEGYPAGLDCTYTVTPTSENICQMEVAFADSYLDTSPNCTGDCLQINDDRLCGELTGTRTYSLGGGGPGLIVRLRTDSDGSGKGVRMTVRQIPCAEYLNSVGRNLQANEKFDSLVDCTPQRPSIQTGFEEDGYPSFRPYPEFSLPGFSQVTPQRGYLPPNNDIPFVQRPITDPPYLIGQSVGSPNYQTSSRVPSYRGDQPAISQYPSRGPNIRPSSGEDFYYTQNIPYQPPATYNPPNRTPFGPSFSSDAYECCGHSYTDSHFLIVSPGFPRSRSADCFYTIRRYSSLTAQVRFQFRYFWVGEDTGFGCTGGYLDIEGTKVCGCKTGATWTTSFVGSQPTKVLNLKLDSSLDRLFNGFVIEVYQDDSYSERVIRSGETSVNLTQQVETFVERIPLPVTVPRDSQRPQEAQQLVWDPRRQSWSWASPQDLFCIRWSFQDFLVLARETLWSRYQCPVSTNAYPVVDSSRGELSQSTSTACRTCNYFCRQNCQCCGDLNRERKTIEWPVVQEQHNSGM